MERFLWYAGGVLLVGAMLCMWGHAAWTSIMKNARSKGWFYAVALMTLNVVSVLGCIAVIVILIPSTMTAISVYSECPSAPVWVPIVGWFVLGAFYATAVQFLTNFLEIKQPKDMSEYARRYVSGEWDGSPIRKFGMTYAVIEEGVLRVGRLYCIPSAVYSENKPAKPAIGPDGIRRLWWKDGRESAVDAHGFIFEWANMDYDCQPEIASAIAERDVKYEPLDRTKLIEDYLSGKWDGSRLYFKRDQLIVQMPEDGYLDVYAPEPPARLAAYFVSKRKR